MKRWFVLLLAAFTFLVAPHVHGLRSGAAARPAVVAEATPPDIDEQLKRLLKQLDEDTDAPKEEAPKIVRPKIKPGEHWVPLVRFTNAPVDKDSVDKVSGLLDQVNAAGPDAIVLELTTLGGAVPSGYEFARAVERSKVPVVCVVDGETASMGYFVLQSCASRLMTKRSSLMIHEPHIGGTITGTSSVFTNYRDNLHVTAEAMLEHEAKRMKVAPEVVRQRIADGKEWNMLYGEALEVGAVDGVVESVEWVVRKLAANPKWRPDANWTPACGLEGTEVPKPAKPPRKRP